MATTDIPAGTPDPAELAPLGTRASSSYVYPLIAAVALFAVWELVARLRRDLAAAAAGAERSSDDVERAFPGPDADERRHRRRIPARLRTERLIGLPLGALIVYARPVELSLYPLLVAFQTIPKAAIAPIFIVWLGTGITSKVLIAFAIAFFPIVIDTIIGLRAGAARDHPSGALHGRRTRFRCSGTCAFPTRCRRSSVA